MTGQNIRVFYWNITGKGLLDLQGAPGDHSVLFLKDFICKMITDQDLGFFANFLGIFIFVLVVAYHYVMGDPKYETI
eukprot:Gb_17111 [translate_table: standard]